MSTENAGSASTQESSGQSENQTNDKVSYDTYRRVLSEAKKLKEKLSALEEEKAKTHEQKLREQNEWKALAEAKAAEAEKLKSLYTETQEQIVNGLKYQEFEKHLGGKLKSQEYATFVPFEKIVINPETRRVDEESVKSVVAEFVKQHPVLVEFNTGARLPNEAAKAAHVGSKPLDEMSSSEIMNELKKIGKLI